MIFSFLGASFLPSRDASEMGKIPALVQHFAEHQQKNPQISVLDFIVLHFQNEKHHNEDHDKHDKLPCQHDCSCSVMSIVCTLPIKFELNQPLFLLTDTNISVSEENLFFTSPSFDIWQPPKVNFEL